MLESTSKDLVYLLPLSLSWLQPAPTVTVLFCTVISQLSFQFAISRHNSHHMHTSASLWLTGVAAQLTTNLVTSVTAGCAQNATAQVVYLACRAAVAFALPYSLLSAAKESLLIIHICHQPGPFPIHGTLHCHSALTQLGQCESDPTQQAFRFYRNQPREDSGAKMPLHQQVICTLTFSVQPHLRISHCGCSTAHRVFSS